MNQLRHLLDLWTCWSLEEQTAFVQKVELEIVGVGLVEERFLWVGFQHLCWWITKFWDIYTKNTSWLQISWHFSIRISCINRGKKAPGVEMLRPHLGSSQLRSGGREQVDLGLASSRIQSLTSKPGGGFKDFFKISSRSLQKWSNFTNIFQMGCKKKQIEKLVFFMKSRVLMVFQKSTPFFYETLSIFVGSKNSCYANELV